MSNVTVRTFTLIEQTGLNENSSRRPNLDLWRPFDTAIVLLPVQNSRWDVTLACKSNIVRSRPPTSIIPHIVANTKRYFERYSLPWSMGDIASICMLTECFGYFDSYEKSIADNAVRKAYCSRSLYLSIPLSEQVMNANRSSSLLGY